MLIRRGAIGFPVDAAHLGFAVGTGFALVENLALPARAGDAGIRSCGCVRGFGTADAARRDDRQSSR